MRKFLTVVFAVLLALFLALGVNFYRRNDGLEGLTFRGLFQTEERRLPRIPEPPEPNADEGNLPEQDQTPEVDPEMSYGGHLEKGNYYFDLGFLEFAANEYVAATTKQPTLPEAHLKLMRAHFELRDYATALNNAGALLNLQPNHYEGRLLKARTHIKLGEFDEALSLLESLSSGEAVDAEILYYKGLIKAALHQNEEASDLFKQASELNPEEAIRVNLQRFLDAFAEHELTQAADPDYLYTLLARAFNQSEEYRLAIEVLTETLKTRTDVRDPWILLGFAYLNLEQYQFSLSALERAYQLDKQWPTTQYFLGINHMELGDRDQAIVFFNYALANRFDPPAVIHGYLAELYFENQNYEKAVESYEKVLELNNQDVDAFVRPVFLHLSHLNQPEKALSLAQIALANFPESAMAHNLVGWSLVGTGEHDLAEDNLLNALELDPNLAAAHYNLGNLYESQNKSQEALEAYQRAYDLDESGAIGNMAAEAYNELLTQVEQAAASQEEEPSDEEDQ